MTAILKSEITGARIVEISYTYKITDTGLDECLMYFTVDRGFSFLMPFVGSQWETSEVPDDAKPFVRPSGWFGRFRKNQERAILDQIRMGRISGVFGDIDHPDDTVIVLDDGSHISNTMVAPHGTGSAGIYYLRRSEQTASIDHMKDIFEVPLDPTPSQTRC